MKLSAQAPTGTKRNEQTGCRYTPFPCRPVQGIQPVQSRRAALIIREVQRIVTVRDAIARLQKVKPNQYDDATLVKWLSDLDGMIFNDVILTHEGADGAGFSEYDPDSDIDCELLAPDPYTDIYVKYLSAQVDFHNAEFSRYNNSMVMFTSAYSEFTSWYNRTVMPLQNNHVRI